MTNSQMPFFSHEVQSRASNHLRADPANAVGLIIAGDTATTIEVVDILAAPARAFEVITGDGRTLVLDRHQIAGFELVAGRQTIEEQAGEQSAANEAWLGALQALRDACSASKDKAVLSALNALEELEADAAAEADGAAEPVA